VRFYVPEWEDHVDAEYDFATDEHSAISRENRNLAYIWDIFDRDPERTPIDGVLISREQIEESPNRVRRLKEHGVYDAPNDGTTLAIPDWLPTISDCGAWGYRELPFPPYGNVEMLDFYEQLNVDVGVTIDHLVLGSGHASRLYIDERAFDEQFTPDDLLDGLTATVDVMVDEWPETWPKYVEQYEPSITDAPKPNPLRAADFDIELDGLDPEEDREVIERRVKDHLRELADDPRVVYRNDDMQFRYNLTLDNLQEMQKLYDAADYPFRLMCAIQGWDKSSYANATRKALSAGYQYLGIGGVAGSTEEDVERYVSAVGEVVKDYERAHRTRVDTHVFGFAKTGAFDTIGRSGMSSFDSASMLRAAWTGGKNYHLNTPDGEHRYDALRVRYPNHQGPLSEAIDTALWSQEVLHALRAYDNSEPISETIRQWHRTADRPLSALEDYLLDHRWDDRYDHSRLQDMTREFRSHFSYGRQIKANFSDRFRKQIIKLLRKDSAESPVPFEEYSDLIAQARSRLERFPRTIEHLEDEDRIETNGSSFTHIWSVIEAYTEWVDDGDNREGYKELLQEKPWRDCGCEVCTDIGIDVAIFRGNNRNRRRGFHNTRNFYDQFERALPKILVVTKGGSSLSNVQNIEEFLGSKRRKFWESVHDLPVAEIGAVTASGVHEWWADPPKTLSFAPEQLTDNLVDHCVSYQDIFIDGANWSPSSSLKRKLDQVNCTVHVHEHSEELRQTVLDRLGYDERTIPPHPERDEINQVGISDF
jgi:hypothetical protein